MAQHPLTLLQHVVSPQLLQSDDAASSKSAMLDQFYPILLSIFAQSPDKVGQIIHTASDSTAILFDSHKAGMNQLIQELSRHHNLPLSTVENLLEQAIPLSAQAIYNEADHGDVASYLRHYLPSIAEHVTAWAAPLLASLGLSHILESDKNTQHVHAHEPVKESAFFRKILPWIALLILLLLLFFWRSCQRQQPPIAPAITPPVNTMVQPALIPVSIALTSGQTDQLLACRTHVGNSELAQLINSAVTQVFVNQRNCNNSIDQVYATNLPGQQKLAEILALVKAVPNATLQWTGDQITINAPNATDVARLVDQIKAIAPELTIIGAAPLNVDQSVSNSIEAARTALTGLADPVRAEDVARALNLQIINFASDSAAIPEPNKAILDQAATLMQKVPEAALIIEGYTDSTGNAAHNKTLSEQRAKSVLDYLVSKGINQTKLQAVGYGQDNPVADNVTEQGKFRNRRIEFKVTDTQTGDTQAVNEETVQTNMSQPAQP